MKVTWEEGDIRPGRCYSRGDIGETWMIGYVTNTDGLNGYVSVSMSDGMVTTQLTKAQMAERLTGNGYLPVELLDTMGAMG